MYQKIWLLAGLSLPVATATYAQYPFGPGFYGRIGGSSTIAGSHMEGMASLVQSSGAANLMNSEAAINVEQARSLQLDNRLKYAQTYYDRRKIRDEAKAYEPKVTTEQVYRMAEMARPNRLESSQFDPASGKIDWPLATMQPGMEGTRRRIEHLFQQRTPDGKLQPAAYFEISRLCEALGSQLIDQLDVIPMQEVSQAKAFLKSLDYEARRAT